MCAYTVSKTTRGKEDEEDHDENTSVSCMNRKRERRERETTLKILAHNRGVCKRLTKWSAC